jgi:lysine decarboxylase
MSDYLVKGLKKVYKENLISFHMPGHKNNKDFFKTYLDGVDLVDIDLTEIPGTDNLHNPVDIIKESQEKLKNCYKSLKSYFLVNGSTSGILSMVFATTTRNDKILINRNAHKSVMNAVLLNELEPIYIVPEIDKINGVILGINIKKLEEILINDKDIKVVLLTYPTYDGICFDIKKACEIVKKYNRLLIIDEAHGSHFITSEKFPVSSVECGADIIVQSAHKNLPAFTQGAYLHINNINLIESVERYLSIFQTSSPSYLIMSSLDIAIDFIIKESKEKAEELINNINDFYKKIKISNYRLVNLGILDNKSVVDYDISKILISPLDIGLTGKELEIILRKEYKIQLEYSTYNYALFIATMFNTKDDFNQLLSSLLDIEKKYQKIKISSKESLILENISIKYKPSLVDNYSYEVINIKNASNRISYESIIPYPPGIPLINPGEIITKEAIEKIISIKNEIRVIEG